MSQRMPSSSPWRMYSVATLSKRASALGLRVCRYAIRRPGVAQAGTWLVLVILTSGRSAAWAGRMYAARARKSDAPKSLFMRTPVLNAALRFFPRRPTKPTNVLKGLTLTTGLRLAGRVPEDARMIGAPVGAPGGGIVAK